MTSTVPPGRAARARVLAGADWQGLARRVTGTVHRHGDPDFLVRSELFNRRYEHKRPAAVISVADEEDVRQAILWAREGGVPVVARSGGHSFAGYSVNDGLVIDLGGLAGVAADGSTGLVSVAGGARVGQVHDAVRPFEMAFPTGTNPLVGIAGLVLGGGCEYLSRKHGLTADALVSTRVVTADGRLLNCDERENSDLFWACRGGGGGNFGINVGFTFQAQPVPDVSTFSLTWLREDAVAALAAMQDLLAQAPPEFSTRLGVATAGAGPAVARDNAAVTAVGCYLGPARELLEILDPVLGRCPPRSRDVTDCTFWDARGQTVHATSAGAFALRSNYIREPLPPEALETILWWVERWPGSSNTDGGGVGLFSWGGAINDTAPDATAFLHRDTLFLVSMDTSWTGRDSPRLVEENLRWLDGLRQALLPWLTRSSYQNFVDPALDGWAEAYYGRHYARLVEVKRAYDPDDVFNFDQSIGLSQPRTPVPVSHVQG